MPFTPYHFGPAALLGAVLFPFLDISALFLASVVLDLEPLIILMFNLGPYLHGPFHSYLGATIVALAVSIIVWSLRTHLESFLTMFNLRQKSSYIVILLSSLLGTYSHVFLDSFLYSEMNPFLPFLGNPFLGLISSAVIYQFCVVGGVIGLLVYVLRFFVVPAVRNTE